MITVSPVFNPVCTKGCWIHQRESKEMSMQTANSSTALERPAGSFTRQHFKKSLKLVALACTDEVKRPHFWLHLLGFCRLGGSPLAILYIASMIGTSWNGAWPSAISMALTPSDQISACEKVKRAKNRRQAMHEWVHVAEEAQRLIFLIQKGVTAYFSIVLASFQNFRRHPQWGANHSLSFRCSPSQLRRNTKVG